MREQDRIIELWVQLQQEKQSAVLATVVRISGSSYRLPGARLLVGQNGQRAGGISGGCLEDDIARKAWWLTAAGTVLRTYDTSIDEDARDGFGLGCRGTIHVLLERVTPEDPSVLPFLQTVDQLRCSGVIAHVLSPAPLLGRRLFITDGRVTDDRLQDSALRALLMPAMQSLDSGILPQSHVPADFFLEHVAPPIRLLLFGAGDDAVPLSQLATQLGWRTSIFDGRAHYVRAEKFPIAGQIALRQLGDPAPAIDRWTAALVMSHSYSQDLDVLRSLAAAPPLRYLGILGPRQRTLQLLTEAGFESRLQPGLHSPMGLDLGGDGPEQVALSIVAEIQAVLHGRAGGFLRDRAAPIHSDEEQEKSRRWVVRSDVYA